MFVFSHKETCLLYLRALSGPGEA